MSVEGFESEILALLQRLESRKKGRSSHLGKKKVSSSRSKFVRELHKVQCSINYDSTIGKGKRNGSSSRNFANFVDEYYNPFLECKGFK